MVDQPLILKADTTTRSSRIRFSSRVSDTFFLISLIFFFLAVFGAGGVFVFQYVAKQRIEGLDAEREKLEGELRPNLIDQVLLLSRRLEAARMVLGKHVFSSNVFEFLESATLPQVRFTSFGYSFDARRIDLNAEAASYATLSRQIQILEARKEVEKVDFGGLSLGQGGLVNFKISVIFHEDLFHRRPQSSQSSPALPSSPAAPSSPTGPSLPSQSEL
ncbi:MAG: hypothetical protein Q7R73_02815 [bacterium]|nr:hypothetical protein [bacterium]